MSNKEDYRSNELIDRLPKHLKQFIKPQNYEDYSPINQAVWRYVMRAFIKIFNQSSPFFLFSWIRKNWG